MATATMTTKGQLTVPLEVRRKLGLQPGDRVQFTLQSDGAFLRPERKHDTEALFGMLSSNSIHLTVEEMHEAAVDAVVEKVLGRPKD